MRKSLFALSLTVILAPSVFGQWAVVDAPLAAQSATQHAEEIAKWAKSIENQIEQIKKLEQQIEQLKHTADILGDPAKIKDLPGIVTAVGNITAKSSGQSRAQLVGNAVASLAQDDTGGGLFRAVGSTFQTRDGQTVHRSEVDYKPLAAVVAAAANHDAVQADVQARRTQLRAATQTTLEQLKTAPTHAESQKLTGVLIGLQAELQGTDQELDAATQQAVVQDIANRNDRLRQEQAHREEQAAELKATLQKVTETLRPNTKPVKLHRAY